MQRFIRAQRNTYAKALKEIKEGWKQTCWMWFIFPQLEGQGYSDMSRYYAIKDREEAVEYMKHPVLSYRLVEISEALLELESNDPEEVMGWPDDKKLQASMTLFYLVSKEPVFKQVLDKYFKGKMDSFTLKKLREGK